MKKKLNVSTISALRPQPKPYEVFDQTLAGFLLRVQPTGRMSYYYSYRNQDGKRKRYCIGAHPKLSAQQARDCAEQIAAKVISGVDVQLEKKHIRLSAELDKQNTLGEFIFKKYSPWVLAERKAGKGTLKRLHNQFEQYFHLSMHEITPWLMQDWRRARLTSKINPATINRDIVALKAALSKAVEWQHLEHHPLEKFQRLKIQEATKVRYLDNEEEHRLRKALEEFSHLSPTHKSLKPMVLLSLNTGLRKGELKQLTWRNLDFNQSLLTIDAKHAKSGKTRHIPLNSEAMNVLKEWRKQSKSKTYLFANKQGKPITLQSKTWKALLSKANIESFRWHDMRHDFASKLVMAGVDITTVRDLLGHADIKMTLRYAHLAPEHKANAVEKLVNKNEQQ